MKSFLEKKRSSALVLLVLSTSLVIPWEAAVAERSGSIPLRFRPHEAPARYSTAQTTIQVELRGGKDPLISRYDFDKIVERVAFLSSPNLLKVRLTTKKVEARLNGRPLPGVGAAPPLESFMTTRGLSVGPHGATTAQVMSLILPEQPLPPPLEIMGKRSLVKTEWTQENTPTDELPVRVTTRYRVAGPKKIGRRDCVMIKVSAEGRGLAFQKKITAEVWGRGEIAFDPVDGIVVEARTEIRVSQAFRKPRSSDPRRIHTETTIKTRLLP